MSTTSPFYLSVVTLSVVTLMCYCLTQLGIEGSNLRYEVLCSIADTVEITAI
jgi:hypothetical protein